LAIVLGGNFNQASKWGAVVCGGQHNSATGSIATVCGGQHNRAHAFGSGIVGGVANVTGDPTDDTSQVGQFSAMSGGAWNVATGQCSFIGGGGYWDAAMGNKAFGHYSAILGGRGNVAGAPASGNHDVGSFSTVCGGDQNSASGGMSNVSGGRYNIAKGDYSFVGGGGGWGPEGANVAFAPVSSVVGGSGNIAGDPNQSSADLGHFSTITGGTANRASGHFSIVSGGGGNVASEHSGTTIGPVMVKSKITVFGAATGAPVVEIGEGL
jgi:hypothetical protein